MNLTRLRVGPFEGPANGKPAALPEVMTELNSILQDVTDASFNFNSAACDSFLSLDIPAGCIRIDRDL